MEFIIGAVFGAGVALLSVGLAKRNPPPAETRAEAAPDESEQRIAEQWENLLSYNGTKQYED